jgi:hypothetical protein
MTRVIAIHGQILALALGNPDTNRDCDDDANDHSRNPTDMMRCR